jgi:ankyrin repeat protein
LTKPLRVPAGGLAGYAPGTVPESPGAISPQIYKEKKMVHKKMLCGKHEQSVMFRGRTIAGVLALMLAGCALAGCATLFGSPDSKAEKAIEKNDLAGLEKVLQKNANKVELQYKLRSAIDFNNLPAVKMLVKYGADVKKPFSDNAYPLHRAVIQKNPSLEMIEYLIQEGAEVTAGKNDLLVSAVDKDLKLFQYLADRGADINASNSRDTVLSLAIMVNRNDVVDYLLEKGVNQASLDSALLTAFDIPKYDLVQTFLEKGVSQAGLNRALGAALSARKYDLVRTIVEKGANVTRNTTILERAYDADQSIYAYLRDRGAPYTNKLIDKMWRANPVGCTNELKNREITFYGEIFTINAVVNRNTGDSLPYIDLWTSYDIDPDYEDKIDARFMWSDKFMSEMNGLQKKQIVFVKTTLDNYQSKDGIVLFLFIGTHLAGN